jgi:hypothetical protein
LDYHLADFSKKFCRCQSAKVIPVFSIAHSVNQTQESDFAAVIFATAELHQTTIRAEVRQET